MMLCGSLMTTCISFILKYLKMTTHLSSSYPSNLDFLIQKLTDVSNMLSEKPVGDITTFRQGLLVVCGFQLQLLFYYVTK